MSIAETAPVVVHESERQRQYARLKVPLSIKIAGQRYDIIDWSVGGFSLGTRDISLTPGNAYSGRIVLPFEDFEVEVKIRFEVCYASADGPRMGCRLIEQTSTQLAILQYMVRAHITGELVNVGDIMDVVKRADNMTTRELPKLSAGESARLKVRRRIISAGIVLAFFAMLALLLGSLYEQLYVVDARSGVVTTDLIQIAAPQGGRVAYGAEIDAGAAVAPGALLATVTTPGGSTYFVESPCNCQVVDVLSTDDSQVGVGTSLMLLAPDDAAVGVSALVPYDQALRLHEGMSVDLSLSPVDGVLHGTITEIDIRRQLSELGQPLLDDETIISAEITIMPDQPLPAAWIGKPAAVTFDLFGTTWLGRLLGADA